jgi:hypothetical protein
MTIRKRGTRYHYDFMIRWQRYRGALPEARTKAEAEQPETKIKTKFMSESMAKSQQAYDSPSSCTVRTYPGPGRTNVPAVTMNIMRKFCVGTSGTRA